MSRMHADMFRTWRRYRHMRRADLARVMGVHPNTIKGIENELHDPSPIVEKKFAALVVKHEREKQDAKENEACPKSL